MSQSETALLAHLMRRAGFGATRDELESYVAEGYEAKVEELLHPESAPPAVEDEDIHRRYHVDSNSLHTIVGGQTYWLYRMVNTKRPLEEKIALFWHHVFATGVTKANHVRGLLRQIEMFRRYGLGSFRRLLLEVSRDPTMIWWLDNNDNHHDAVNENYGRELLELFSLGVGNYTEDDVRQASRAFTGWTMRDLEYQAFRSITAIIEPYHFTSWQFQYNGEDHDDGEKTFLGETGNFNGEDIIDVTCRQPATAMFVSRHLYNFFVADEPQVPAWETVPPRDPDAIKTLMDAFVENDYEIRAVLRVLFNSDFFKDAAFARVKSPAEFVAGTIRLAGSHPFPLAQDVDMATETTNMGQKLLDPPSVEGWHTGPEWITTVNMVNRVNFAVKQFSDMDKPGIRSIIDRVRDRGPALSPEELMDACLDLTGPLTVSDVTRGELLAHARTGGGIRFGTAEENEAATSRIKDMLQLIAATREYQMA